jgi:hypothetical protein
VIVALTLFTVLSTLFAGVYMASSGMLASLGRNPDDPAVRAEIERISREPGFLATMMFGQAAMGLLTVVVMTAGVDRRRFSALGLGGAHGSRLGTLGWGFLLGAVLSAVVVLFITAVGARHLRPVLFADGGGEQAAYTAAAVLAAAFMEEWLVRGYLYVNLREQYAVGRTIFLTALFFAFFHSSNPGSNFLGWVNVLLIGVVLGQLREISGGLNVPIGLHAGWNLVVGMLFGAEVSGLSLPSALRVSIQDLPAVLGGGEFGPEGSVVVTVLFGVVAMVLGARLVRAAGGSDAA